VPSLQKREPVFKKKQALTQCTGIRRATPPPGEDCTEQKVVVLRGDPSIGLRIIRSNGGKEEKNDSRPTERRRKRGNEENILIAGREGSTAMTTDPRKMRVGGEDKGKEAA